MVSHKRDNKNHKNVHKKNLEGHIVNMQKKIHRNARVTDKCFFFSKQNYYEFESM